MPSLSNLHVRIISACILAPLVLSAVYIGGLYGVVILSAFILVAAWEWGNITLNRSAALSPFARNYAPSLLAVFALFSIIAISMYGLIYWWLILLFFVILLLLFCGRIPSIKALFTLIGSQRYYFFGVVYITLATISIMHLRFQDSEGLKLIFWLLTLSWVMDSCAYFTGSRLKGAKIFPAISPNKTWSGFMGGVIGVFLYGLILAYFWQLSMLWFALFSVFLAIIGHMGDFFESFIKRKFEVKDSSNIIPGHGGVLDRFDSFIATAIATGIFAMMVDKETIFMVFT